MSLNYFMTREIQKNGLNEFNLNNNLYFNWMQLIQSIP